MELQDLKDLASKLEVKYHHLANADTIEKAIKNHCENTLHKSYKEVAEEHGYEIEEDDTPSTAPIPSNTSTTATKANSGVTLLTFDEVDAKAKKESNQTVSKDALKLVRVMITCNNKNKSSYKGEIFSARNAAIEEVKKFVPFGVATHIPEILLNMIKEKEVQMFYKERLANGNNVTRSRLIPEYNIQILPPITAEEFNAIKRKQLAEGEGTVNE